MANSANTVIQFKKLSKFYGKFRGVENINLKVQRGCIFGFLGPNGAGKTTTISMVMGLLKPTAGGVRLFGKDNTEFATENRAKIHTERIMNKFTLGLSTIAPRADDRRKNDPSK